MPARVPWFLVRKMCLLGQHRAYRECDGLDSLICKASQLVVRLVLVLLVATAAATAARAVVLGDDWRADALDLLVLLLDLFRVCLWVRVEPRLTVLESIHDLLLLLGVELLAQTLVLA